MIYTANAKGENFRASLMGLYGLMFDSVDGAYTTALARLIRLRYADDTTLEKQVKISLAQSRPLTPIITPALEARGFLPS